MSKTKKLTACDVVALVEQEGLDYALLNYIDPKNVKDPKLAKLCKIAKETLQAIEQILEEAEPVNEE
jgi:hypothetical protein